MCYNIAQKQNNKKRRFQTSDGTTVRVFRCNSDAVSAYVSGDEVNIQLANGHSEIYKLNGMIVRRF